MKDKFIRKNLRNIRRIEFNQRFFVSNIETSTPASEINNWGFEKINVSSFWQNNIYGQNTVVAVIDSGLDLSHPLLKNQIYRNPSEIPNNNLDDDNNGYIDDVTGYNFLDKTSTMIDDVGHGTHVSGIIAIEHNETAVTNSVALGVAPQTKILPLRFIGKYGGTLEDALLAIDYVKSTPAKIINASWGGNGCSKILSDKIASLESHGVLFITAAGNNGSNIERYPEYPAAFELSNIITVGSISPLDGMSSFSNYSTKLVHVFAPGFEIYSAIPGSKIAANSGTSMAAPFVSGAAALLKSQNPELSLVSLKANILNLVTQNSDYMNTTRGRLDLVYAPPQ